jgi:tetratricopeptide (TPR) repeat protein
MRILILSSCLVLLLAACSGGDRGVRPQPGTQGTGVVHTLGTSAEQERVAGRFDNAALLYERALRIEPYNAGLWHGLARVRYEQESWRQALVLATKSNTLAGSNRELLVNNWKLIGDAHQQLGEDAAARDAYDRAAAVQQRGWRRFVP